MTSHIHPFIRRFGWLMAAAALLLAAIVVWLPTTAQAQARCALAPRLRVGDAVEVIGTRANRLRSGAGLSYSVLSLRLQPDTVWYVQRGPVCADGINWYEVAAYDVAGWTAEGEAGEGYYLQRTDLRPQEGCYSDRLAVGIRVMVGDTQRQRVRPRPSTLAPVSAWLSPGVPVTILDGPRCANGWVWWYISGDNSRVVGWTPEGANRTTPWLVPAPTSTSAATAAQPTLTGAWVSSLAGNGLAALTFSPDKEVVTMAFSEFSVDTAAETSISRSEQIKLPVNSTSRGYLADVSLQGTAYCDPGSQASVTVQVGSKSKVIACSTLDAFTETLQVPFSAAEQVTVMLTVQADKQNNDAYAVAALDIVEVTVKRR